MYGPKGYLLFWVREKPNNESELSKVFGKPGGGVVSIASAPLLDDTRAEEGPEIEKFLYSPSSHTPGCALPFVTIKINNQPVKALPDSSASRTFFGPRVLALLDDLGIRTEPAPPSRLRTATGCTTSNDREAAVTLTLKHREITVRGKLLPSLTLRCILGIDALQLFGISLDFTECRWSFRGNPFATYTFESELVTESEPECFALQELTAEQARTLDEFLRKEIPPTPDRPGMTTLAEHHIDVAGHAPIKQRYYPVSPKIQEAINEEVDRMLRDDIIEPSNSEWSTPIVMVRKPNGTYRFCLDFRKVNEVSRKDAYPLPYMNSILDKLRKARYISTIDLSQAYFQIPLARDSREITAFTVPGRGLFHFKRMPYGLTGAPATFQRLLDKLIGPEM